MNIDALECPELDYLIRQHVMNVPSPEADPEGQCRMEGWNPSTNIMAAFEALHHLQSEDWHVKMSLEVDRGSPEDTQLFIVKLDDGQDSGSGMSFTFPIAFCQAALKFALDRKGVPWC